VASIRMKKKKSRGLATRSLGLRARCRVVAWRARKSLGYSDNRAANRCRAFTDPSEEGARGIHQDEEEKEPRVGHSQSGPASQMQGGRLARQKESGGTLPWYPSDAVGGDADPKV